MEKFFNNEIVELLKSKNRNKMQDILYQDGDKFIWKKSDLDKSVGTSVSSEVKKAVQSSLSFKSDPLIALYPESQKSSLSSATDVSTLVQIQPNFRASSYSRVKPCKRREDLEKLLRNNYGKHQEVTTIRALLGPFPDEPFMAAVDQILFFLRGLCGGSTIEAPVTSKSSIAESDSQAFNILEKSSNIS